MLNLARKYLRERAGFQVSNAVRWGVLIWLAVRLTLSIIGALLWVAQLIPDNSPYGNLYFELVPARAGWQGALLGVWQRWDAIHYMRIASSGYIDNSLLAFFPLYPLLSRFLSLFTGGNILLAMLVVSNIATIFVFVLLYQFTEEVFSEKMARLAVMALAIYPGAVYLYAPYAEPVALCLVLMAYQSARHGHWRTTFLAGLAAGLSHPIVIPMIILLGWEACRRYATNGIRATVSALGAAAGPAIGMSAYFLGSAMIYSQSYFNVQSDWGRNFQWPWQDLTAVIDMFRTGIFFTGGWANVLALILSTSAMIWSFRRLPLSAALFQASVLLMFLIIPRTGSPLDSFMRHSLIMFPLAVSLAAWYKSTKHPLWSLSISAILFVYLSIYYFLWQ
jgi:hypothetical protein